MPNRASPPWKPFIKRALTANLKENKEAVYLSLATLRPSGTPANRTVVFRGFAGEERDGLSPWESDLPTFTTDVRSAKIEQIQQNSWGELCWRFPATGDQFRLTGRLYPIAHHDSRIFPSTSVPPHLLNHFNYIDIGEDAAPTSTFSLSKLANLIPHETTPHFSWDAERQRLWHNMSDDLRATFTWPTPGEPQSESIDAATNAWIPSLEILDKGKGLFWHHESDKARLLQEAFKKFVIVVMEVEEVDHLRLFEKPHSGRTLYKREDQEGNWTAVEVNP
ncbi:pyridoxamine 5'-phosphate oxidase-domain-containing protein [Endogone sp. FLAS-F59071]|nr:pyridoxamine 5'-phosphate oxidase-domain-containing protein [Endogone sp. FLAS-F59071]|eukprot:RUS22780.1 pyridoxamine 5'-phosphate oxidase-domain-containing protein [Endogone sp. FLAS-F59071]